MENQVRKCTKCSTVDQATVFRWGHQRRERQPEIPQVILPCRSPVNANYRTHISVFGFKKLEYRIKIVQNAALWTRLRFSGGAIKEERDDRKPSGDFTPSQPGRSRDYRTLIEHIHSGSNWYHKLQVIYFGDLFLIFENDANNLEQFSLYLDCVCFLVKPFQVQKILQVDSIVKLKKTYFSLVQR